jgi:hypothetical protein
VSYVSNVLLVLLVLPRVSEAQILACHTLRPVPSLVFSAGPVGPLSNAVSKNLATHCGTGSGRHTGERAP